MFERVFLVIIAILDAVRLSKPDIEKEPVTETVVSEKADPASSHENSSKPGVFDSIAERALEAQTFASCSSYRIRNQPGSW